MESRRYISKSLVRVRAEVIPEVLCPASPEFRSWLLPESLFLGASVTASEFLVIQRNIYYQVAHCHKREDGLMMGASGI